MTAEYKKEPEICFRPVCAEDIPSLTDIYNYYVINSTATCQIDPISEVEMERTVIPTDPKYRTFVILLEGQLCGYVLFTRFKERMAFYNTAEVTIYLKQGFTSRGIGKRALSLIEENARQSGIHSLVSLISSENEASIRLFNACGYRKCAEFHESCLKFGRYFGLICCEKLI